MTARTLMAAVALFGLIGSTVAQEPAPAPSTPTTSDPTPDKPATPAATADTLGTQPQPSTATPASATPTPSVASGSVTYPTQPTVVYPNGVVQSGYAQPTSFYLQNQMMVYPQGQVMPAGYSTQPMTYAQPGTVTYAAPMMAGTIYPSMGYAAMPATGYRTVGGYYPTYGTPSVGTYYPTYGTSYPTFANGYVTSPVSNVVSYPTTTSRRLFRR